MKITENNPKLFQTIGDIFPFSPDDCYKFCQGSASFLQLYKYIIRKIYLDEVSPQLLNTYLSKFSERRLSNAVKRNLSWYGLQEILLGSESVWVPSLNCINTISSMIYNLYREKWDRMSEDFKLTYDVLKPLQMDSSYDTITDHMETTSNSDNSRNKSGTSADNNETEYDNTDNKIYGFNSADGVNSDSSKNTSKDNSNGTFSSSDTYKGTDIYSRDANSQKTVTRSGNIGNRLPSEMLLKEIEFRKNMLKDIIVSDINSILTRSKYI
uniref:Uncharacterized protein n=1 Tax=Podoviridae sp. cty7j44 TaxID=2826593 RepID=A0A8S5QZK7_9CAUD|nr:MAG TPA: hypothetical protein [Podoviridae sp. cty7j44]